MAEAAKRRSTTAASLEPGFRFEGPAIVEQYDTTVYVPAGFSATVDPWYNIIGERMP